jgi:hypothetical protein
MGGGGGFATAKLNVNPGEQYTIIVGGGGLTGAGPGVYGGGGAKDCGEGGRGGGRSAIRNAANIELITAGAGGGGGGVSQNDETGGHGGGGLSGEPDNWLPYGGGAGTQTEGGTGGHRKPTDPFPDNSLANRAVCSLVVMLIVRITAIMVQAEAVTTEVAVVLIMEMAQAGLAQALFLKAEPQSLQPVIYRQYFRS